ncbi:hypothetical protein ACMU_00225 [Actibacterium mucosum KCTC 23349]|uniref:Lipoprotein n=1 Tax=Actibacterium mucosum KCTC 23349 TaxID=1454373 RepID=A0A037ZKL1_9RHOB|nr:hypothetical protein [Actibacterium mucosum]KAJ56951.1 hypothetical protein ACMU_00225 [Actibacterium mucosum KCTC 23349]
MRKLVILGVTLAVTACASPQLQGSVSRNVDVENSSFRVFFNRHKAEATRTNLEFGPNSNGIMQRGYRAIQLATGCEIVPGTFDGDPALMRAELFCPL